MSFYNLIICRTICRCNPEAYLESCRRRQHVSWLEHTTKYRYYIYNIKVDGRFWQVMVINPRPNIQANDVRYSPCLEGSWVISKGGSTSSFASMDALQPVIISFMFLFLFTVCLHFLPFPISALE